MERKWRKDDIGVRGKGRKGIGKTKGRGS